MLRQKAKITFTKADGTVLVYDYFSEIEINSGYENLTDTARITIPRKLYYNSGEPLTDANWSEQLGTKSIQNIAPNDIETVNYVGGADAIFKRGDRVKIEIGYFPNLETRFEGYISKVQSKTPVTLECEDAMYLLKQYSLNISHTSVKLSVLLDEILEKSGLQYDVIDDIQLGKIRASFATPVMIFDELQQNYGLNFKIVDGRLRVGFPNDTRVTNEITLKMEQAVINGRDLEYMTDDETKIRVRAVSIMPDNSKIELFEGDADGEERTFHAYNLNETELRKFAQQKLLAFNYTGFRGAVTTFGEPTIRHGDMVKLISTKLPERNSTYLVKGVKITAGMGGYRQECDLGIKVQ